MGKLEDLKGIVENEVIEGILGRHGVAEMHERGERLLEMCV